MYRDFNKILFFSLFFAVTLFSCVSPKKFISNGQYDLAIEYSVKKLKKKSSHSKSIFTLEEAFNKANQVDKDRISFLEIQRDDSNLEEIFSVYNNMKRRQLLVKTVYPFNSSAASGVTLNFVNFDDKMMSYKKDASDYLYSKAKKLLLNKDKLSAREAYRNLIRVKGYYPNYNDNIDFDIQFAKNQGTLYFLLKVKNKSSVILPKDFAKDLKRISLGGLNRMWKEYHSQVDSSIDYDYFISLKINEIQVSPEIQREKEYNESKTIKDGTEYVLDSNGNVLKDSLGNDVQRPKEVEIICYVNEIYQKKSAVVTGSLEYLNLSSNQIKFTDPIRYETSFEHKSAKCVGDKRALSKETKKICSVQPLPFPSNPGMIMMTADGLKNVMISIISKRDGNLK